MKADVQPAGWSSTSLATAIVVLTALQAAIVLRFGSVPEIPLYHLPSPGITTLLWDPRQVGAAFVGVPTARHDVLEQDPQDPFQAVARLSIPSAEYQLAEFRDPTRWLTNPPALRPPIIVEPASAATTTPRSLPPPLSADARPVASRATLVVRGGGLSRRAWLQEPVLGPWPGPDSPGTTRLEAGVNQQGWIVVLRVSESSGSAEADDRARKVILQSLFAPGPGAPKRPSFKAADLSWGTLSVEWGMTQAISP